MVDAYIGLGSNLGDGRQNVLQAWENLAGNAVELLQLSTPYISKPVGFESSNWFVNAVGKIQTILDPQELLQLMLGVEAALGRIRRTGSNGYEDRIVDLDILFYDNRVINSANLLVPHPEVAARLFVLQPLEDIAPQLVHPQTGLTATEMLIQLLARQEEQQIESTVW